MANDEAAVIKLKGRLANPCCAEKTRAAAVRMSTADLSIVLDILRTLYRHIQTLEEFANGIVFREGQKAALVEQADTNRFKSFVRSVFVCFDKELQQIPSCKQVLFTSLTNKPLV